jgi:tetratricopeptide (TPR) repeat protein
MVGSIRTWTLCLVAGLAVASPLRSYAADDPPRQEAKGAKGTAPASLEDVPAPFVPLHPRTVEDRKRIEVLKAYSASRALEDLRMLPDAIDLLEQAIKKEPDSVAILRRLSRLCFVMGRTEMAIGYSRRVIEADPNDSDTLQRLVRFYDRKNDADGAETLLTRLLANPKLDKTSPAYLLALQELGMHYRERMLPMDRSVAGFGPLLEKSAEAFGKLLEALDSKAANELAPADERRILGGNPAEAYLTFGAVLLEAKRYEMAIKALRRGLVYAPDQPLLTTQLAGALLEADKPADALEVAERFVKQHPEQREGYSLLARSLSALKRETEILPRLEEAAKADPKNRAVQYALADRYSQIGQRDRANALYEELRNNSPNAQDFGALAAWLLKEKRTEELIKLLGDAVTRRGGFEAVKPQIEAIAADPAYSGEVLDVGLKMMAADPPTLSNPARRVLSQIASESKVLDKLVPILRLAIKNDPNPADDYTELADTLTRLGKFDEAAVALDEFLAKYPNRRNARLLVAMGQVRANAGKMEAALEAYREALKLEPNDPEVLRPVSIGLSRAGKADEGLELARGVLKLDPANPDFNQVVGVILTQAGKNEEAIAHYKGLLERFPNNDDLVKLARSSLSGIYVTLEDYAKGEAELEVLLEKDPDDPGINNDLGYLYADQGKNLEKAEAMIRKAVAEEPNQYAYLDSLGWVLFKRGKVKEAVVHLEKAAALPNGSADATIVDHLGDVYFRLHEYAKAKGAWEKAAKVLADAHPPDKRLAEVRKKLESLKELEPAPRTPSGNNP